ncbi:MAG: hypothetical protein KDK64_03340 [Chlamydiia bacterium]|nr:hypothetical protein [Chlamydiia bacterium]
MESTNAFDSSGLQTVFESVCAFHETDQASALKAIYQRDPSLSHAIQSTYGDLEASRAFLQSKDVQQLRSFIQGLREIEKKYDLSDDSSLNPVIHMVASVGREKEAQGKQPTPARVETVAPRKLPAIPKPSVKPPAKSQQFYQKLQALDMDSPHFKEEAKALLKELETLDKNGLINKKLAEKILKILRFLLIDQRMYPSGLASRCFKRLEREFPAISITQEDIRNIQRKALGWLKLAVNKQDADTHLLKHCNTIVSKIHEVFDRKIEAHLGRPGLERYKALVAKAEEFKTQTQNVITVFLSVESQELSQGGKEAYQSIKKTLTYLDLSEESGYVSTVTSELIDSFDYTSITSDQFGEKLESHVQEHSQSVKRQVELNDWFLRNRAHVKKAYNQSMDPSLHGLAACSMIALKVAHQLHNNRSTPSEAVDFSLTPKMFASVQAEYKAGSSLASKQVMASFMDHFDLEVKESLPIMTQEQMKAFSTVTPQEVAKAYREANLNPFAKIFENQQLPIQGKQKASIEDLTGILPSLKIPGVMHIVLSNLGEKDGSGIGHDIVIQLEPKTGVYRLIDSNVGVVEFNSHKEFVKEVSTLLNLMYPGYTAFMAFVYK